MPTIVKRSTIHLMERHTEPRGVMGWQVRAQAWSPPVDVYETTDAYVVRMEIGGMHESDFEVLVDNHMLLITGVRADRAERRAYHQMELQFGKFSTAIGIPWTFDADHASAEYQNGFLTVLLPKPAQDRESE